MADAVQVVRGTPILEVSMPGNSKEIPGHGMSGDALIEEVRNFLQHRRAWDPRLSFDRLEAVGERMLVVVRRQPHVEEQLGVYYSLLDFPVGPNTGEVCADATEWAQEIAWDLDEYVGAGADRAERSTGPGGVTILTWTAS